jgi:putative aldouronate transport system permease protein
LNTDLGIFNNKIIVPLGFEKVLWYQSVNAWPAIMIIANMWKYTGYGSIIYIASISGFDPQLYEAAAIDGATKWQQISKITLPLLTPIMVILTILAVGRIFRADFAMFFSLPNGSGILRPATLVLDVYVFEMLRTGGAGLGRPAAAGLYQSVVGFFLIIGANWLSKRFDESYALF